MDALESAQCTKRSAWNLREIQVKLCHFVAGLFAGIGHCDFRNQWTSRNNLGGNTESAIAERCVAQPKSERIKRGPFEVTIRAALHRVVLEGRQLVDTCIESYGQTPRGIVSS